MSGWISAISNKAAGAASAAWSAVKKGAAFVGLVRGDQSRAVSDVEKWKEVIVRLDLNIITNGQLQIAYGTGFFLNIPGAAQDVIVTAGHNLIRPAKDAQSQPELTSKIDVKITDGEGKLETVTVTPDRYRICTKYKEQPGPTADSADDYGVILLDRPVVGGVPKPREAFGFNIILAAMDLSTSEPGIVLAGQVGGYPGKKQRSPTDSPKFGFAAAGFGKHAERQLYYHAGTDQGMSGGPVWVNFLGDDIVVGIHNKHEEKAGEGNRGARLGLETLQNIVMWSGTSTGLLDKAISVHQGKSPSPLFIQCGIQTKKKADVESLCYSWSGPQRDPELTSFDITPAQCSPTYGPGSNSFYLICHKTPSAISNTPPRFLRFNTDPNVTPKQVGYTLKPDGACLVKLEQGKKTASSGAFKPSEAFKIVTLQNHDVENLPKSKPYPEFKLTFWTEDIPPPDDTFGLERARLGLIMRAQRYKSKPPVDYEEFRLA